MSRARGRTRASDAVFGRIGPYWRGNPAEMRITGVFPAFGGKGRFGRMIQATRGKVVGEKQVALTTTIRETQQIGGNGGGVRTPKVRGERGGRPWAG